MQELRFLSKETRLSNYSVIPNELYGMGLSSTALILYAKLLNRSNLSITNGRMDETGKAYVLYKLEDLSSELGKSISTIKSNMNELVEAGLVVKRRADTGRANMIFVKVPDSSVLTVNESARKSAHQGTDNAPYKSVKSDFTRGRYVTPNNNSNNTKIITNYDFKEGESL